MIRFFKGIIKAGKWISDKTRFRDVVSSLPEGNYLFMLIKQNDRTTRENQNHYFLILGQWENDTGYTRTELHDIVKNELFVELFDKPISTTKLTNDQWTLVFFNLTNFLITKFENR